MNNAGTLVIAPIRPQDSADTYPVALAEGIAGGWHVAINATARDAIPDERRTLGMIVYVLDQDRTYTLKTGTTNADWVITYFNLPPNAGQFLALSGGAMSGRIWFAAENITFTQNVAIDFDRDNYQTITISGPLLNISTTNRGAGKTVCVRIVNQSGNTCTFSFDTNIRFLNNTKPVELVTDYIGILTMTSFGPNESDTVAVYASDL